MNVDPREESAREYAKLCQISLNLKTPLGRGQDGTVWASDRKSAVKAIERIENFNREIECYQRFAENNISRLNGFSVPQLMGFSPNLLVIEMRIVTAPFILDFAKAWLDEEPEWPADALAEWELRGVDDFGEKRWGEVKFLIHELKKYGIYYYDAKPGNIMFKDDWT